MSKKEWRILAIESVCFLLIVLLFSAGFDQIRFDAAKKKEAVKENVSPIEKKPEVKATSLPSFASKTVVLDAGHGGYDEGGSARKGKYQEKKFVLQIVKEVKALLNKNTDIKVRCTRLEDEYITKKARAQLANSSSADLFISVHCNISDPGEKTAHGIETLYGTKKIKGKLITSKNDATMTSKKLSKIILEEVVKKTGRKNRGVFKRNELYLMNHSKVPVTIVEVGYLSNKSDLKYIRKKQNQKQIAEGIYNGIIKAFTS